MTYEKELTIVGSDMPNVNSNYYFHLRFGDIGLEKGKKYKIKISSYYTGGNTYLSSALLITAPVYFPWINNNGEVTGSMISVPLKDTVMFLNYTDNIYGAPTTENTEKVYSESEGIAFVADTYKDYILLLSGKHKYALGSNFTLTIKAKVEVTEI